LKNTLLFSFPIAVKMDIFQRIRRSLLTQNRLTKLVICLSKTGHRCSWNRCTNGMAL